MISHFNPGLSVSLACVPGRNTTKLIARVFSDRMLNIVHLFYPVSMSGEVKDPAQGVGVNIDIFYIDILLTDPLFKFTVVLAYMGELFYS